MKNELYRMSKSQHSDAQAAVSVNIIGSSFSGDIAQNITKISTAKSPKIIHPPGSIGANLPMKGYIDYLIGRYFDYRKQDKSYGRVIRFSHAVIHKNIEKQFGAKTFFLPEHVFHSLVEYLTHCIDRTIQGRRNRNVGVPNYHSFDEHCTRHRF
jgi:hypothetical protein